ncbi:MAG: sigma-54 dependent transcriptional regulator [Candidatus Sumerlaeota bacterium]|nr:sigma-54 dependent transcriptional regulator [Candidatus Sumerlaeota bacterium]
MQSASEKKILIVDDEPLICEVLQRYFSANSFDVAVAFNGEHALELAGKTEYPVAIVDLKMPGMSGTEVIHRLRKMWPSTEVIIYTANPSFESSVEAIREQVFDYICKPSEPSLILQAAKRALERRRLILENRELIKQLEAKRQQLEQEVTAAKRVIELSLRNSPIFIGSSAAIGEIRKQVASVAPSNMNILLLGESGTGKDMIAQLIHQVSGRETHALVKVNCPAIPESLLESELFGHEAGAFTGALKRKPGRFELASGGTLFLDEVGDIPFALQSKLLESVEQKQFYSVGGKRKIHSDARIVAATNAPLEQMVEQKRFRADLYYRLNEFTISIPPLRERKEDIPILVDQFLEDFSKQFSNSAWSFTSGQREQLLNHSWPGNVRELKSVIRRFVLTGQLEFLSHSPLRSIKADGAFSLPESLCVPEHIGGAPQLNKKDGDGIEHLTMKTLAEVQWNRRKAAKKLGISYSTLRRRIERYESKEKII